MKGDKKYGTLGVSSPLYTGKQRLMNDPSTVVRKRAGQA